MTNFKITLTVLILAVFKQTALATTWGAAYPYTQQIEGQNVVVKAFPYNPFSGSPMIGVTKVYSNKKLLYTIDKYYRQAIFTSNDGQYLIVVYTSFSPAFASITSSGVESLDVNEPAIEVLKNGKPFRTFSLKDVIAKTKLANDGHSFYWNYRVDFEAFQEAKSECKTCKEIYGRKVLRTGDTSEIDLDEWEKCKSQCDSASYKKTAI